MSSITIIDYGHGNLKSVFRALENIGQKSNISSDPSEIVKSDKLILPGVGAFESGIKSLEKMCLLDPILDFLKKGNPLLGICLGMQLLFTKGKEHGNNNGINIIPGTVDLISNKKKNGEIRKVPHVGWGNLKKMDNSIEWKNTCLENIKENDFVYFTHSYAPNVENNKYILALTDYDECLIPAAVKKDNVTGLQFHPEKSGKTGLKILEDFSKL